MSTGDITNGPYATRAKEYVWSKLAGVFPRRITPSDIDGAVEINNCFFIFEGKTEGTKVQTGQALFLKRCIGAFAPGKAVLVLGEHPPLDRVDVNAHLTRIQYGWRSPDGFVWAKHVLTGAGCLWELAHQFSVDADTRGYLEVGSWQQRIEHEGRPFTEGAA